MSIKTPTNEAPKVATEVVTSNVHETFSKVRKYLQTKIIGQSLLVDRLLIALLADGHLLVEGAPGLAKTTAIT